MSDYHEAKSEAATEAAREALCPDCELIGITEEIEIDIRDWFVLNSLRLGDISKSEAEKLAKDLLEWLQD